VTEIFPREVAANPEPFTGERLTSALSGQAQIEHYHRYLFARTLARDRDVLDVASGEGYGAALLAQVARSVIGAEFAASTVRSATANFPRENLTYLQADARCLPLPPDCVDLVVSFETIEHFDRQEEFVAEVRRVLRPGGCFIVSTPDREIYSAPGMAPNPFHVRELSRAEFVALLHQQFPEVTMLVQRTMIGSVLIPEHSVPVPPLVFDRPDTMQFQAGETLPRAPYLVAIASDRPLPAFPASLYIERSDLDTEALALAERTADLTACAANLADRTVELAEVHIRMGRDRAQAEARITRLASDLAVAQSSLRGFLQVYLPRLRRHLLGLWRR
jgi:SAM-dependent methyltransferase